MKARTHLSFLRGFVLTLGLSLIAIFTHALDYPHTNYPSGVNTINCGDCHFTHGTPPWDTPPSNIDETFYNNLCFQCHNDVIAPTERTHSSLQLDNSYGNWSIQCWKCHDPHAHEQPDAYGSSSPSSYLYSGTSDPITNLNQITKSGAGWTTNQFAGMMVIPNTSNDYYVYQIISNTPDTLTVKGPMNLTLGNTYTFAIFYGRLVRSTINAPDMDTCEVIANEFVCGSTIPKTVRFFREKGSNSFADGDTTYDGVCEVCHTQPTYHRNDATANHTHNVNVSDKCTKCHYHLNGFRVPASECNTCHGYPPVDGTTLVSQYGNPPVPGTTGSATAGAHDQHVNRTFNGTSAGFGCGYCHSDSVGSDNTTHNNGDLKITLGFSLFGGAYQGGAYDGQTTANYNATTTSPPTNVTNLGNKTCSNLYCHSIVQTSTGGALTGAPGEYKTPVWDGTVRCGDCHKADGTGDGSYMDSGSHTKHAQSYSCDKCHNGAGSGSALHVNNNIDVVFDPSLNPSGTYSQLPSNVPGNGLGTCSNLYCHGTGAATPTPTWGGTLTGGCPDCHGFPPATNAHAKHVQNSALLTQVYGNTEVVSDATNYAFGCGNCHPTNESFHSDNVVDISLNPADGGTLKSLNSATAFTTGTGATTVCNQIYCHSDGSGNNLSSAQSLQWGGAVSGACTDCHGNSPSTNAHNSHVVGIHYKTIYDKPNTGLLPVSGGVGSGAAHGDPNTSTTINCNICHNNTITVSYNDKNTTCSTSGCHNVTPKGDATIASKIYHVNGVPDVAFATVTVRSKAQIRDDITTVTELNSYWARQNLYKNIASSHDSSKATLSSTASYSGGTCSTVACHNGYSVTWDNPSVSCQSCHKELP
jgi:predicted CxxxxCH...CXXCH cytochrome family protein